jgi:hypothetical protein
MNKLNVIAGIIILIAASLTGMSLAVDPVWGQDGGQKSPDSLVTPVTYTSENLRDPFEGYIVEEAVPVPVGSLEDEETVPPVLKISGISWGSSFPQAIVNDKVVRAGDRVDDVEIVSIKKEGLVFLYNKRQFVIPAPGLNADRTPGGSIAAGTGFNKRDRAPGRN